MKPLSPSLGQSQCQESPGAELEPWEKGQTDSGKKWGEGEAGPPMERKERLLATAEQIMSVTEKSGHERACTLWDWFPTKETNMSACELCALGTDAEMELTSSLSGKVREEAGPHALWSPEKPGSYGFLCSL